MTQNGVETALSGLVIFAAIPMIMWRKLWSSVLVFLIASVSAIVHAIGGDWLGTGCAFFVVLASCLLSMVRLVSSDDWF